MGFSSLEIGKRALLASKVALDVTSNNIANVNTEGYSRRVVTSSETDPHKAGFGYVGTGVLVDKLRSYREEFFDKEIRNTGTRQAGFDQDSVVFKRIEAILAEPSEFGLNEITAEFFNAFEALAQKPEDLSLRQNLLMISENMVERFHITSLKLTDLKSDIVQSANVNIDKANNIFKEIANLNNEVTRAIAHDGVGAQTFVDEREKKLEELSKLFEINRTSGEYGSINVFINGMNVITGSTYTNLKLREKVDGSTGKSSLQIVKVNNQNSETIIKMNDGELGSMLKHYNDTLNSLADSETFSVMASLDKFVDAIAKNVNNITVAGYGLNDITAPSQGRTFFEPSIGRVTADTIQISQDIAGNPENIPLSAMPDEPGDSEIARKIAKLSINQNFLDSQTPSEYYTNILGQLGLKSKSASNGSETTAIVSEQLNNQRESIIGVNLDEEAINLIKYQKSFEAASRVINATSAMLSTIINMGS